MPAKPRINLRFNERLLELVDEAAAQLGLDKTAFLERAAARALLRDHQVSDPVAAELAGASGRQLVAGEEHEDRAGTAGVRNGLL